MTKLNTKIPNNILDLIKKAKEAVVLAYLQGQQDGLKKAQEIYSPKEKK